MPRVLEVLLNDRLVGTITNLPSDQNLFVFDEEYIVDPQAPVLSQGFYDSGGNLIPQAQTAMKAHPFFSNLLPENELRDYLAERGRVNAMRDFPLLWLLGEDLPGAVRVKDAEGGLPPEDPSIRKHETIENARKLRFSLAGVQLKFSAIRSADGGLSIPAQGAGGHWIAKLPSVTYQGVPENEWSMMTFARHVGIDVPRISLDALEDIDGLPKDIPPHLGTALAVERFDRAPSGIRIHIEDFAQVFRKYPVDKYKGASNGSIVNALALAAGSEAVAEFVRRLVFNIGIANADMHLKNWSLIYPDGRSPRLAPGYDYVSTIQFLEGDAMALSIARTKQWADVSRDLLERFARRAGIAKGLVLEAADEMVGRMNEVWPKLKNDLLLSRNTIDLIERHQARVPLFNPRAARAVLTATDAAVSKRSDRSKEVA